MKTITAVLRGNKNTVISGIFRGTTEERKSNR